MHARILALGIMAVLLAGCAVRLGGPKPVEYRAVGLSAASGVEPAQVAALIREARANVVLLAAEADAGWFDEVARQSNLSLSGPGVDGSLSWAFLAGEAVGDTTVALRMPSGGEVVVHDALYRVDRYRYLDLMALRIDSTDRAREAVGALLGYVATDVMPQAAVVLAIDVPDAETGDRVAALLSPVFRDVRGCLRRDEQSRAPVGPGVRLFFGPEARVRCEEARAVMDGDSPLMARLIVNR